MKKKLFLTTILFVCALHITAFAYWIPKDGGWKWECGSPGLSNEWQWIDGNYDGVYERYYFDENGYCLLDTTTPDGCQVNASGAWILDGQVQTQTRDLSAIEKGSLKLTPWAQDILNRTVDESDILAQVTDGKTDFYTATDGNRRYIHDRYSQRQYGYLESTQEIIAVVLPLNKIVEGIDYVGFDTRQMCAALNAKSMTPMKASFVKDGHGKPCIVPGGNTDPICRFVLDNGYTLEIDCYSPFRGSSYCMIYKTGGPLKTDSWSMKLD